MKKIMLVGIVLLLGFPSRSFALSPPGGGAGPYVKGAEKISEGIKNDLKPEERQKDREKAYFEESTSYDARKSAGDPKYWQEKRKKEQELLRNATDPKNRERDEKTYKTYDKIDKFIFGEKDEKGNHIIRGKDGKTQKLILW